MLKQRLDQYETNRREIETAYAVALANLEQQWQHDADLLAEIQPQLPPAPRGRYRHFIHTDRGRPWVVSSFDSSLNAPLGTAFVQQFNAETKMWRLLPETGIPSKWERCANFDQAVSNGNYIEIDLPPNFPKTE